MCDSVLIYIYPDSVLSLMLTEIGDSRSLCNDLHLLSPAAPKTQKPKLLKPQPRKVVLVSIPCVLPVHIYFYFRPAIKSGECCWSIYSLFLQPKIVEENLTYAELDLVMAIPDAAAKRSGTVYAQILFEEQQLWDQICLFLFIFAYKKMKEVKMKEAKTIYGLYFFVPVTIVYVLMMGC